MILRMASPFLAIDSSSVSHLALCDPEKGGCGWRGAPVRTRSKAQFQVDEHRATFHPDQADQVESRRRARSAA